MYRKNCVSGIFWAAFFVFFIYLDSRIGDNASYWPGMVSVLGLALSLISAAVSAFRWRAEAGGRLWPLSAQQAKRFGAAFLLLFLWIICMNIIGFLVSSILFMAAFYLIFEPVKTRRNIIRDAGIAVIFGILMYALFTVLGISFPQGFLI